jgi:hypothetical protein
LEDLFAINYRFQGLAEKKPETQETVLVKRIKYRVRSIKGCWLVLDAGIYSYQGVFKERCKTQETNLGIMAFLRGLCVKPPLHPLPLDFDRRRTGRFGRRDWGAPATLELG